MRRRARPMGGPLGWIGEGLFRAGRKGRLALYASGLRRSVRLPVPVVSIGNLTVGGTGKTPIAMELAERFRHQGWKPALLSRGYGRNRPGRLIAIPPGRPVEEGAHALYGDEPCVIRLRLPDLPIVLAPDRAEAGRVAIERFGSDLLLLDDGMQHVRLRRERDVVVVRGRRPFGNGRLLPRGPLREPAGAIGRADLVLINRTDGEEEGLDHTLDRAGAPSARARFRYFPTRLLDPENGAGPPEESLRGRRVLAVSGLGNPDSFESTLRDAGADVVGALRFPDHHRFTQADCERMVREAARLDALPVTTEKDRVRLREEEAQRTGLHVLQIGVRFTSGLDRVESFIEGLERSERIGGG